MEISKIPGCQLSPDIESHWIALQDANPSLASPFFSPQFTAAVASVRNDVEIALIKDGPRVVGILPFERHQSLLGCPVGGILSDYQGIICEPGFRCNPARIVRNCDLNAWHFDHLITCQSDFRKYYRDQRASPVIDLTEGYESYVAVKHDSGSDVITQMQRKSRKLAREIGPLRFEEHTADGQQLELLIGWKSRQYVETGACDLFSVPWIRRLIEKIYRMQSSRFSGVLSFLYAGDIPVAAHMGIRSQTVWHYWFPAYDLRFAKYSPGILLLLKMAEVAPRRGISLIDLGRGEEVNYKRRLSTRTIGIAVGAVELPSVQQVLKRNVTRLQTVIRRSPLAGPLRAARAWLRG